MNWYFEEITKHGKNKVTFLPSILAEYMQEKYILIGTELGFYVYDCGVYKLLHDKEIKKFIKGFLRKEHTPQQINNVFQLLEISCFDKSALDNFNSNTRIINTKNCIIDLSQENIKLKKHDPSYLSTIQIDVEYNKNAKCELWEKTLNRILSKEQKHFIQEILGYFLITDISAKKFFNLYGPTDCGKSIILGLLNDLLKSENISNVSLQNICNPNLRFESSKLYGKIANIVGDLSQKELEDTGLLKMLTGSDSIDAEKKGKDSFQFFNKAKIISSMNIIPPNYSDKTEAYYKRILIVLFNESIPESEQDKDLGKKLKNEYSGILNWCLEGLVRLLKNKLIFSIPKESIDLINAYKENNNPILCFLNDIEKGIDYRLDLDKVYEKYKDFTELNGNKPLSKSKFKSEIEVKFLGDRNIKFSKNLFNNGKRYTGFIGISYMPYEKLEHEGKILDNVLTFDSKQQKSQQIKITD